ncbi:Tm-1-like ATP-binding domain-containing protein [Arthrobacter pascens]|uniref:Tm-1-like ATP-binding domain-containing protein n=1 Tax=Arthrobacter pascens TaxID=1677 RepID=UPI00196A8A7A|nr:Tm-1-like ATP-binding domain-containing protein [Arthrobacter pascens]MBN3496138.1 Tm-1-like ATP-binding domain-containing protein [Arthrobacter pascens]
MTQAKKPAGVRNIEQGSIGTWLTVLVIGTLDTKSVELTAVAAEIEQLGASVILLDTSGRAHPDLNGAQLSGGRVLISREEVAEAAGYSSAEIDGMDRGEAVVALRTGVAATFSRLINDGRIHAALCVGGAGAYVTRTAFETSPIGFPKMVVSPLASGNRKFEPYVGTKDVATLHSVADIVGLNSITSAVLRSAAGYVVGAAAATAHARRDDHQRPAIAVSLNGNTTDAVMRARDQIESDGYDLVAFHANGVGGRALENFVASGQVAAVLDYTLTELAGTKIGGLMDAGPDRMETAGRLGLPQVLVPGCLDFITCGDLADTQRQYPGRTMFGHNPELTLVRLDAREMGILGQEFAKKANLSTGPTVVCIPEGGFSINDREGGRFWAPAANQAFIKALKSELRPDIKVVHSDRHINDDEFVSEVVAQLRHLLTAPRKSTATAAAAASL